jgi:hypothetical protein
MHLALGTCRIYGCTTHEELMQLEPLRLADQLIHISWHMSNAHMQGRSDFGESESDCVMFARPQSHPKSDLPETMVGIGSSQEGFGSNKANVPCPHEEYRPTPPLILSPPSHHECFQKWRKVRARVSSACQFEVGHSSSATRSLLAVVRQ